MFQSVIGRHSLGSGRFGTGMWISLGLHAGLLAAVVFLSSQPKEEEPKLKEYTLRVAPVQNRAKGTPAPVEPNQARPQTPQRPKPPKRDRVPRTVQPLPTEPTPVEPTPTTSDVDEPAQPGDGIIGGHPDGDPNSTAIDVPVIPGLISGDGSGLTDVLAFGPGMTPPAMLGGEPIEYTTAARNAGVEGTLVAKCTITREGTVEDCRILKGLPHMNEAVISALETRRYRPVTFQGRPVSVSYSLTVRLAMPR